MIPSPQDYPNLSGYELLEAAADGYVGLDHRWLHALIDDPGRTLDDIVRFAGETHEDDREDLSADLELIASYLRRSELLPFLIERVRAHEGEPPDHLVETIIGFREKALEPLLGLYAELGHTSAVPFMLAGLGIRDERIETILDEVATADPEEGSFCREVYEEVAGAPGEAAPYPIWDDYPEEDTPPFDLFSPSESMAFLDAASAETRFQAIMNLDAEPDLEDNVVERLREAGRNDADDHVRGAAWATLQGKLDEETDLLAEMRKRFLDSETLPGEVAGLAIALAGLRDPEVQERLRSLFEEPATRAAAIEAMGSSFDATFAPYVVQALDDPDLDVRRCALTAAGQLRLKGELGRIKTLFGEPELRIHALIAYALAFPTPPSPGRMRSLFKQIDGLAGGLDSDEAALIEHILDDRLEAAGKGPAFHTE